MASNTCTVSGQLVLPGDSNVTAGRLIFALNTFDVDTDETIVEATEVAELGGDGTFSIDLWSNYRGERASYYTVSLVRETLAGDVRFHMGTIQVPDETSADLEDLLNMPTGALGSLWVPLSGADAGAEIAALYEGEDDRNAFSDAEKAKLAGVEVGATADQTGVEIKALYEAEDDTNAFTDADVITLAAAAPKSDVTDLRAEEPQAFAGTFHYSQNYSAAITDGDGNILMGVDLAGNPMLGKSGVFPGLLSGWAADISFAWVDDDGRPIMAADIYGQPVQPGRQSFHYGTLSSFFAITDNDGLPVLRTDREARIENDLSDHADAWLPYIAGGKIRAVGYDDLPVIDYGDWTVDAVFPHRGDRVRAILDEPMIGAKRTVTGRAIDGGFLVPDAANVLHVIVGHGQSLMTGAQSALSLVLLDNEWPDDAMMASCWENTDVRMGLAASSGTGTAATLDGDCLYAFEPIGSAVGQGSGDRGNTPLETAVHEICKTARTYGVQYRCVGLSVAKGSSTYEDLKQGELAHTNMINAVTRIVTLAEREGWQVVVDCVLMKHGESDFGTTTYAADLVEWQADVETDLQAITGQTAGVPMIVHQPSSHRVALPNSTLGMLAAHNSADPIFLAGADYPYSNLYDSDFTHMTGAGYVEIGKDFARAHNDLLWSPVGPQVIQITAASRVGTTVTLTLDAPGGALYFDTTTITERDVKGFTFEDDSGAITINSATITDDGGSDGVAQIELELDSTPSGTDERVLYAISPQDSGTPSTALAPRGNVRNAARWAAHQIFDL